MKPIIWTKDNFTAEQSEFKRVVKEYSGDSKKDFQENLKELQSKYASSSSTTLTDSDWKQMLNTDSWTTDTVKKMENAISRNNQPRNVSRIFYQYASLKVSLPIALRLANGKLELIAGNTRLMGARVLGINPKIIIIKTDW